MINSKQQPNIWLQMQDLEFEGLIKSKLKVIKPAKHLLSETTCQKMDVINVLIRNPSRFIFLLVSNTIGENSRIIILSQYWPPASELIGKVNLQRLRLGPD